MYELRDEPGLVRAECPPLIEPRSQPQPFQVAHVDRASFPYGGAAALQLREEICDLDGQLYAW